MRKSGIETVTELAAVRKQHNLSAAELARLVGVSRQTIYAIEDGTYTPNTTLALKLASALHSSVEDLFRLADGECSTSLRVTALSGADHDQGQTAVRLVRVHQRIIAVRASGNDDYLPAGDAVMRGRQVAQPFDSEWQHENRLLLAGCDPALSLLADLVRSSGLNMVTVRCSSRQALEWLRQGRVHVAGTHLLDESSGEYNKPVVRQLFAGKRAKLVSFASWQQGIVVAAGNPREIGSIADFARRRVQIVNRERGAGARELLDAELRKAGLRKESIRGYETIATGHLQAARAVATGQADACIASQAAANAFALSFIPLSSERFDFCIPEGNVGLPSVHLLLNVLNERALRLRLATVAGYDTSKTGAVIL